MLRRSRRTGQEPQNSWQILSGAHLVRCDFQWVAKSWFDDSRRRRLARRDETTLPEACIKAMFPAPGRPPTRHLSGRAARDAVGFSRRGGSSSPSCITQQSHPSAHHTPWGTTCRTRRNAPRTHLTSVLFLLPYPHARGQKAQSFAACTVAPEIGSSRCRSPAQPPPVQTSMRSRFGSTCSCRVQLCVRQVFPQHGYTSRFLRVTA